MITSIIFEEVKDIIEEQKPGTFKKKGKGKKAAKKKSTKKKSTKSKK